MPRAAKSASHSQFPDVFVPELGVGFDELAHELFGFIQVQVDDLDAVGSHELGGAGEGFGFADDDLGDLELHRRSRAEVAGHQRRVQHAVAVAAHATGPAQGVDLGVCDRVAVLDPPIVPASENLVAAHQHRPDRNPALGQPLPGLLERRRHVRIKRHGLDDTRREKSGKVGYAYSTMTQAEPKSLQEIVSGTRYPLDAFHFVRRGLDFAVHSIHQNPEALTEQQRHISGRQLSEGLRDFAIEQYGQLARTVLARWNIHRTDDFGRIVFAMVEGGLMQATERDSVRDFDAVFDFDTAFDVPISLDGVPAEGFEPDPVHQQD